MTARRILRLADLGYEGVWLLVQQACGIPDARARSSFLDNMTVALLFAQDAFPERLCMTAAVRQMGGHVVFVSSGDWKNEVANFPLEMGNIVSYYVDCVMVYGLDISALQTPGAGRKIPLINGGSPSTHPLHALADIACMQQCTPDLSRITVAWVGSPTGTLNALIEALEYFPFKLRMALPQGMPDALLLQAAKDKGRSVEIVPTPLEAVQGANYICAGCLSDALPEDPKAWFIDTQLMTKAAPNARILLSAAPLCSTPIAPELLQSKFSLLYKQAENRLRVCKRMLHWVFSDE